MPTAQARGSLGPAGGTSRLGNVLGGQVTNMYNLESEAGHVLFYFRLGDVKKSGLFAQIFLIFFVLVWSRFVSGIHSF